MQSRRVLGALGLDPFEERLYVALVADPTAAIADIARDSGVSGRSLSRALTGLEARGLVSRAATRPLRYVVAPPDAALELLRLRCQEGLEETRPAMAELAERFHRARPRSDLRDLVEIVTGGGALRERITQALMSVRSEMIVLDTPPYTVDPVQPNLKEIELLRSGIRMRAIYSRAALDIPNRLETEIQPALEAGEEARVIDELPVKLFVADRRVGITPLSVGGPEEGAIVFQMSPLLAAIEVLFEALWERATPLTGFVGSSDGGGAELTPTDRRILQLMLTGFKDRAIASQLSIGQATVERRVRRMMQRSGAHSRFQLAHEAGRRGWIPQ